MLKKISIRMRLTILSVLLLGLCCVLLSIVLNFSASHMVNTIEASVITPSQPKQAGGVPPEIPATDAIPLTTITPLETARNQFFEQSILYVFLVVMLGGGLTYFVSGRALKPLQTLSDQMKNRTVHNLSESLPVPETHDEIADLTQAFNEMSGKLEEAFSMQRRFSQSAAHELRTPLTVLKTKVDVFQKKREHTPQEYDKLLQVITAHTNRLSNLVVDLLELTNMDALDCDEPIALKGMLSEIAEELAALAAQKQIAITVKGTAQTVCGNRSLLHRAFYNLVENAVKYNLESGQVTVFVGAENERSTVFVTDTGIGIAADSRDLIFEPFYRVDKSRSRQMGGAGLGLSTVKAIVEKHGGSICVTDNPAGGSIFSIIL